MNHNILFLCTGNSARSQMGEAFLRKYAGDRFEIFSAGTKPAAEIFPPVVEAMKEIGIDLSDRKPKGVGDYLGKMHFLNVIIVCSEADRNCPAIFGSAQRLFWPFEDPASAKGSHDEILTVCRRVRDEIDRKVREWLSQE